MKVPYEWLNEFVVLDVDPYELASRLTMEVLRSRLSRNTNLILAECVSESC